MTRQRFSMAHWLFLSLLLFSGCTRYRPVSPPIAPPIPASEAKQLCRELELVEKTQGMVRLLGRLMATVGDERNRSRVLLHSASPEQLRLDILAPNAFVTLRTFLLSPNSIEERASSGELITEWSSDEDSLSRLVGMPIRFADLVALVRGLVPASAINCGESTFVRESEGQFTIIDRTRRSWYRMGVEPTRLVELNRLDPFRGQLGLTCSLRWSAESLESISCQVPRRDVSFELLIQKYQRL